MNTSLPQAYQFLLHTPEKGLRSLMMDPAFFSEVHFNLMLKIVRGCDEAAFCQHFSAQTFPKVKMSANEMKVKEKFWSDLEKKLLQQGLMTPESQAA